VDSTPQLIAKYLGDSRIKYIDQKNAGVTAARNAGIKAATGELLTFVDSDDYIELDMYEKLYAVMELDNADVAVCDYNLIYDGHAEKRYSKIRNEMVNIYDDVYSYFARYCACAKPNNYIWTRLYKTEIIEKSGVRFEQYELGDDTLFNFKLLPHYNRVAFVPDGLYNYFQRGNSNVYTVANKRNLAIIYADTFQALADYYNENRFVEFLKILPIHAFSRLRSVFFYSRLAGMSDDDIIKNIIMGFKGRDIAKYLTGASI
jgi:glycosyltransferase involved in cell wall biosynthesis